MTVLAYHALRSVSVPQRLLVGATVAYAGVFVLLVAYGRPGLGVSQGFYVPIVLAALATDAATGALAGLTALGLYVVAELLSGRETLASTLAAGTGIRLASFVAAGLIVGWFATRARRLVADSLHVLDDLLALNGVERDER
ncbi:MAG TPA: hypothetical protein VFJ91_10840 [Gaiellaceae bacterium]|nr:hypothetical protein [Gaiellaceae bacterium]